MGAKDKGEGTVMAIMRQHSRLVGWGGSNAVSSSCGGCFDVTLRNG